jgi:hypothetical protein
MRSLPLMSPCGLEAGATVGNCGWPGKRLFERTGRKDWRRLEICEICRA